MWQVMGFASLNPSYKVTLQGIAMSIEFLITSLIVIVSPGTGVHLYARRRPSRGSRASVVAAFGCTLGIVPHMAARARTRATEGTPDDASVHHPDRARAL